MIDLFTAPSSGGGGFGGFLDGGEGEGASMVAPTIETKRGQEHGANVASMIDRYFASFDAN